MYSVNMQPILIQAIVVNAYIYMCVWISSPENIGRGYKTYMFDRLGRGGGGSKEMTRFHFFANIGNYRQPLTEAKIQKDTEIINLKF